MSRALLLGLLVVAAGGYVAGWWRLGRRAGAGLGTWRLAAAVSALAALATALASPLDALAHERFSAHMVQHLLLLTVVVPLSLLADPFPVMMWALPARGRAAVGSLFARGGALRPWLRALTAMPVGWLAFAAALWLWHLPALYERALDDGLVHALEHATLLAAALLYWWPLLDPAPRVRRRARPGAAIAYVVLAAFQSAALGLALMLWPSVLYAAYARGTADALADQAWGGLLMWTVSGVVDMAVVMALVWRFLRAAEPAGTAPWTMARTDGSVSGR